MTKSQSVRRIMIVDDEPDICDCLEQFFRSRGFAVQSAFSGEEAVERLNEGEVDCIILDVLLPGLTGLEVLKHAKALHPQVRVIVVTAVDDEGVQETARRYGADAVISKPFDFSDSTWSRVFAQPT